MPELKLLTNTRNAIPIGMPMAVNGSGSEEQLRGKAEKYARLYPCADAWSVVYATEIRMAGIFPSMYEVTVPSIQLYKTC